MIDPELKKVIGDFIEAMTKCDNEDEQMTYVGTAANILSNSLGVFIAHRIMECDCNTCRKGADEFLHSVLENLKKAAILTITKNLTANGCKSLYVKDSASNSDVNWATYEKIMEELKNGQAKKD